MSDEQGDLELVSISALNQYVFCPRRCALMHVEGIWRDNEHTVIGSLLHDHADEPGYAADDGETVPVEYKKGKRRSFENDDIQLCAQALCLEEMFACEVSRGFIYHAASRRRRE